MKYLFILIISCLCFKKSQSQLLLKAHSHNDYRQSKPLYKALDLGFTSIEIDIYSKKNKLKVSHLPTFLFLKKDIETLYFKPLEAIVSENGGTVFKGDSTQLILLIDFKTDKNKIYPILYNLMKKYSFLFETYSENNIKWGPIKAILTGNPPMNLYLKDSIKFSLIDGTLGQLQNKKLLKWFGLISTNYKNHFSATANNLSETEKVKMQNLINSVHSVGLKLRFWGTENNEANWKALLNFGCDFINVDKLDKFRSFYINYIKTY